MKRAIGIVLAMGIASSGCAFNWGASQLGQGRPPFDENARSESVPLPGVLESLIVNVHFSGRPVVTQSSSTGSAQQTRPASPFPAQPVSTELVVDCQVVQSGREKVYRAATRYGKGWKYATAAMFVLEGAFAALLILSEESKPEQVVGGWILAADALGTGALFFVPSRDVYETKVKSTLTPVRDDCPDGLTLELAGQKIIVEANGEVGELGAVLLRKQMESYNTPVRVSLGQNGADVFLSGADRCTWARRTQHPDIQMMCSQSGGMSGRMSTEVTLAVPLGSLIGPETAQE